MGARRLVRYVVAAVTVAFLGVLGAAPDLAGADTPFTWSGGSSTSMNWSDAQNWGGSAPTNGDSNLDLTFPTLSGCVSPDACQHGTNDLTGLGLHSLSFTGTPFSASYTLGGQAVTLGGGGISSPVSAALSMPIQLTAPQNWTINGSTIGLSGGLTGSEPLTVNLLSDAFGVGTLGVSGDAEVGPVAVAEQGYVTLTAGPSAASLNGGNGNTVSLGGISGDNIHLIAKGPGSDDVGPLSVGEGAFVNLGGTLGLGESPVANLHVNGSVDFAATGGFADVIDAAGTTAGVDYGELTATGDIALNGASFSIVGDGGGCPAASDIGDTFPLISTPGTISGIFNGAADGELVPVATSPCSEMMQMHYSPHEVFGTIVNTTGIGASIAPSATPNPAVVGQSVTYSVTASGPSGIPAGSVTFDTGGVGTLCTATLSSGSGSCTSSAAPQGNPDDVNVYYSGDTTYRGSTSGLQLTVNAPSPPPPPPPTPHGYWLVGSDGGIFSFGSAQFHGSMGGIALQRPVVGIVPTSDRGGYWLDASDGGVFSFGDTQFYGSIPGLGLNPAGSGKPNSLNAPIVGMVPSHDQGGYFMVASDGGVFAFGDAHFAGSCPGIGGCSGAAVAVMPDASGNGYWLVTATGNLYTFGDAPNLGAPGLQGSPITSAVPTPDGGGYYILDGAGQVFAYGDANGSLGNVAAGATGGFNPSSAIFVTSDNGGYWVSDAVGDVFTFGDAPNDGSMAGTHLNGSIIAASGS